MSLAELLPAVRALPRAEQVQLMHLLVDELTRPDLPPDDVLGRALVLDACHFPSAETMTAIQKALDELYPNRVT